MISAYGPCAWCLESACQRDQPVLRNRPDRCGQCAPGCKQPFAIIEADRFDDDLVTPFASLNWVAPIQMLLRRCRGDRDTPVTVPARRRSVLCKNSAISSMS